jgi:hypothetical protein
LRECSDTDVGVLGRAEVGSGDGASTMRGVRGVDVVRLDSFLFSLRSGEASGLSGNFAESADELCDPERAVCLAWLPALLRLSAAFLPALVLSAPNAASRVSARLWTPYVLSCGLLIDCVLCEADSDCSISCSLLMKNVVGPLFDGVAA